MDARPSVMILCGGTAMRMRGPQDSPKALTNVGGRPIIWHIMKHYAAYGFDDFVLCLGHLGHEIKRYFREYDGLYANIQVRLGSNQRAEALPGSEPEENFNVKLIETGDDAQTGARVFRAARHARAGTFLLTYGDGVSNVDIEKLLAFHKSHGRIGTVTTVQTELQYARIHADATGRVDAWREKPKMEEYWVSAGYFVFERAFLDYLSDDNDLILERSPLERLVRDGQLMTYRHDGFWRSMDTQKDAQMLNDLWYGSLRSGGRAPWRVW